MNDYFDARDYDLAGRIGKLKTRHGTIETPYIFPVVDPSRQEVELEVIRSIGFNALITNAYLLYKRSRGAAKDVHEALGWNGPIMTDSGGYQILAYGEVEVSNKKIVEYQKLIGSDIAVILDVPTGTKMDWQEAEKAVEITWKRALEAMPMIMDSDQLWVLPIQGAPYRDLLTKSAIRAAKAPFSIYAFGSPTVLLERYEYSELVEYVGLAKLTLRSSKPLHVFGVGHPMILPFLVALGSDLFDSASYILYARENRYMLETGTKRLEDLRYLPCSCPVCSKHDVKDLLEMPKEERTRLIAIHNLYALKREINNIKAAISEGRLWELLEHRSKAHPSLRRAFESLKKFRDKLLRFYNPSSKPSASAIFILDEESLHNPRIASVKEKVQKLLESKVRSAESLTIIPIKDKPADKSDLLIDLPQKPSDSIVLFVHPALGIFPKELSNTYPFFQHETSSIFGPLARRSSELAEWLAKSLKRGAKVRIVRVQGSEDFAEALAESLISLGIAVEVL